MTEINSELQQPWMQGDQSNSRGGNPAWVKGCASPNPKGRPRGSVSDKRTALTQRMLDESTGILDVMIDKALEGDSSAANLILSRSLPVLRSQMERVEFEFDATAPVATQVEQVLAAIANGAVAPDVGKQIIDAIGALSAVRATEELTARIEALEKGKA